MGRGEHHKWQIRAFNERLRLGRVDLVVALRIIRCLQVRELKVAGRYFSDISQHGSTIWCEICGGQRSENRPGRVRKIKSK